MTNIKDYTIRGAIIGGAIGAIFVSYQLGKTLMPYTTYEMASGDYPDYSKYKYIVETVLMFLPFGIITGGVHFAAAGAAVGAVIGVAKKKLEHIVSSCKS